MVNPSGCRARFQATPLGFAFAECWMSGLPDSQSKRTTAGSPTPANALETLVIPEPASTEPSALNSSPRNPPISALNVLSYLLSASALNSRIFYPDETSQWKRFPIKSPLTSAFPDGWKATLYG